ncbi:hypothetical protein [Streptosporangium nondiastaticum]|uniref:hypothetical protein n=1 Tax=Streptosporangium nondiastaticum TaxID=35764 RepID=UPI00167B7C7B|nr:hypothetical protein [Streptosporangium nondiastaticum]
MTRGSRALPVLRAVAGACGVALMGVGMWAAWRGDDPQDPWPVVRWLAGAVLVHDGIVAPLTLLAGLVVVRLRARRAVRGGLLVAASVTAVAYPVLFRPGVPQNPSVLPLDYVRNWLFVLALTAAATAVIALTGARARAWARRPRTREGNDGRKTPRGS